MSSSSRPWFDGRIEPLLHHPVGVRAARPRARGAATFANAGWRSDVAGPHHARVDAVRLHVLLELGAPDARLGPDQEREHVPPGVELGGRARQHEHVGVACRRTRDSRSKLRWRRARLLGQLVAAAPAPNAALISDGSKFQPDLVEDEQVVVLDAVDLGEEALVALLASRRSAPPSAGPSGAAAGSGRPARRRRAAPSRRCRPR